MMLLRLGQVGILLATLMAFGCQPKWTIQQTVEPMPVLYGAEYTARCTVGGDLKKVDHVSARIAGAPGEETVVLKDDGTQGDQKAGDGVFTLTAKPPAEAEHGKYDVEFTARDKDGKPIMVPSFTVLDKEGKVVKEVASAAKEGKGPEMTALATTCSVMLEKWGIQPIIQPEPLVIGEKFNVTCKVTGNLAKVGSVSVSPVIAPDASIDLSDAGDKGDAKAGDGIFSLSGTLPDSIEPDTYELEFAIYDKDGNVIEAPYLAVLNEAGAVAKEITAKAGEDKKPKMTGLAAIVTVTVKRPEPKEVAEWTVWPEIKPDPIKIGKKFTVTCKVTGDLSKVGWVSVVPIVAPEFTMELRDDGKNGDEKAGDGIFTLVGTPPSEAEPGLYELECVVYDKNGDPLQVPSFKMLDKTGKKVTKEFKPKEEGGKKPTTIEFASIVTVTLE